MKYITLHFELDEGIRIAIDENLPIETIQTQLDAMLGDASKTILKELFIPIKERQEAARVKRDARKRK